MNLKANKLFSVLFLALAVFLYLKEKGGWGWCLFFSALSMTTIRISKKKNFDFKDIDEEIKKEINDKEQT